MAALDWSRCAVVESIPGKVSGAWVFKGTRTPVAVVFENLEDGMTIDEVMEFPVTREPRLAQVRVGERWMFSRPVAGREPSGFPSVRWGANRSRWHAEVVVHLARYLTLNRWRGYQEGFLAKSSLVHGSSSRRRPQRDHRRVARCPPQTTRPGAKRRERPRRVAVRTPETSRMFV